MMYALKLKEGSIKSPKDLERLYVRNIAGNLIPLSELVSIKEQKTSVSISRVNRQRAVAVYGNLPPKGSQSAAINASEDFLKKNLPPGYTFALEGAAAGFAESFRSLFQALIVGILVAYLILAVQFNSFIHPISVLMALPFSVSGAFLTLWLTNQSLSIFSFIGLIVLMGIAKKNSIMLVEFANQLREKDHSSVRDALIKSGEVRLRPILMTSIATIAAAIPLVMGTGLGHETRAPMGWAIIGGSLISTIFTLFVVPAIYELLTKLEKKSKASI
ncbi:MAG: efflux RND transporter permease subunit [Oligoflexia bacterium]|nr:efflux RND transporter permease subunit [Oligoflexia bacterium]